MVNSDCGDDPLSLRKLRHSEIPARTGGQQPLHVVFRAGHQIQIQTLRVRLTKRVSNEHMDIVTVA